MSARHALAVAALAVAAAGRAHAQASATPVRVERMVRPGASGPNRLPVDSALLVHASPLAPARSTDAARPREGMGEIRLYDDASSREVPYLLVWPSGREAAWVGWPAVAVTPRADTSGFELDMTAARAVDRLQMLSMPDRFLKRVRLEGSVDRVNWIVLVGDGTLFNMPSETGAGGWPLRQAELAFPAATVRYLRLTADDHAGAPLPVPRTALVRMATPQSPAADSMRTSLRFERRPSTKRTSRYHLTLPATRLPIVALEIDAGGEQIKRRAVVTEPRLGNGRVAPVSLGWAVLRRMTVGGAVASNLQVPIEMPMGADLDLVIDDGDNPPLDLRAVRAVLAPLPSIYFESDSGLPLRATYGGDRGTSVPPPQYDLEALRDTVNRIPAATATWGPGRPIDVAAAPPASPASSALSADPGAPLDPKSFRFARALPDGGGLTAVRLDAAALAHSRIEDARILDADGRQVPYLLETLGEPTVLSLPAPQLVPERSDEARSVSNTAGAHTWYRVALPLAGLPEATLRLETSARVFEREITVLTRDLPRDAPPQFAADHSIDAAWTHQDPESAAPPLEIPLGARRLVSDSLFVLVVDGDNRKLPLTRATILLPTYRLRFFRRPGVALQLVYGRSDLPSPRYDIALLAPRLLDAAATEVVAAPEQASAHVASSTPQRAFWAALAIAVLVLLGLIARLVRAAPVPTPDDAKA